MQMGNFFSENLRGVYVTAELPNLAQHVRTPITANFLFITVQGTTTKFCSVANYAGTT